MAHASRSRPAAKTGWRQRVKTLPDGAEGIRLDVADEAAIRDFFQQAGELDHLVYAAGESLLLKPVSEMTSAEARGF